jgi:hypothetical protein
MKTPRLDISIPMAFIVVAIAYICKEVVSVYVGYTLALILFALASSILFGLLVGLHRLAMLRLDYLERVAQVKMASLRIDVLNDKQSLVMFNLQDGSQTLVTAPKALPAPPSEAAALPAPLVEPQRTQVKMLDFEKLIKCASHFFVNGATNDGKSTIVIELMNYIRLPYPQAEVMLIDPKNSPDWTIPAQINSIEDVPDGIDRIYGIMTKRIKNQDIDAPPIILIIDEHDWIYEEYGGEYISKLRKIFKVGRQYNVHLILIGQSPIGKDNGLSGPDMLNFGRVILGHTIGRYLRHGLDFTELRKPMQATYKNLISEGRRACVVVPAKFLPFVGEVPEINHSKPTFQIEPILIENWPVRSETKQVNVPKRNKNGRTDGRIERISKAVDAYLEQNPGATVEEIRRNVTGENRVIGEIIKQRRDK